MSGWRSYKIGRSASNGTGSSTAYCALHLGLKFTDSVGGGDSIHRSEQGFRVSLLPTGAHWTFGCCLPGDRPSCAVGRRFVHEVEQRPAESRDTDGHGWAIERPDGVHDTIPHERRNDGLRSGVGQSSYLILASLI